jgi:hypothetical protein
MARVGADAEPSASDVASGILATTTTVTGAAVACRTIGSKPASAMEVGQLIELSAVHAVAAMRRGELKAEDFAGALLALR